MGVLWSFDDFVAMEAVALLGCVFAATALSTRLARPPGWRLAKQERSYTFASTTIHCEERVGLGGGPCESPVYDRRQQPFVSESGDRSLGSGVGGRGGTWEVWTL